MLIYLFFIYEGQLNLKQAALIALGTSLLVLGSPARADEEGEQAGWGEKSLNNHSFLRNI